jgi:hypothetical protein
MPFTAKLLTLSPWLVLFLINLTFITPFLILLYILQRCWSHQLRRKHNDVASAIFNRAGAIYGVMLAFVVVVLWQQYHQAEDTALREGNAAFELYRSLTLYPDKNQTELPTHALFNFIRSVINEEYPAMAQMQHSPRTQQAIDNLWADMEKIKPKSPIEQIFFNKLLKDLENLTNLRDTRLLGMDSNLPKILWVAIILGGIVILSFSTFLGAEKYMIHAVSVAMLAIIISITIFMIIELDYPFIGDLSVKPTSYIRVLQIVGTK